MHLPNCLGQQRTLTSSIFLLGLILSSCVHPTPYQPDQGKGGYTIERVERGLLMSRFSGNSETDWQNAQFYSVLAAVITCQDRNKMQAEVLSVMDYSTSKTIQHTLSSTNRQPSQINMSGTMASKTQALGQSLLTDSTYNMTGTMTGGNAQTTSSTWNETLHFPDFVTLFSCEKELYRFDVEWTYRSEDLIGQITPDQLGALQCIKQNGEAPSADQLQVGDLLIKVNGRRVLSYFDLRDEIKKAPDKKKIPIEILRNKQPIHLQVEATNQTNELTKYNKTILRAACRGEEFENSPYCRRVPAGQRSDR